MKTTKLDRDRMRGIRNADPSFIAILDDLDELEEKCNELQGLYGAEYDHTKTLLARCARQEELLERAQDMIGNACSNDACDTGYCDDRRKFLSDLEEFRKK